MPPKQESCFPDLDRTFYRTPFQPNRPAESALFADMDAYMDTICLVEIAPACSLAGGGEETEGAEVVHLDDGEEYFGEAA